MGLSDEEGWDDEVPLNRSTTAKSHSPAGTTTR